MSKALKEAINARDIDGLARLLAAGESPNLSPETLSYTPLAGAVTSLQTLPNGTPPGSIDAVVLLLRYGADVNALDKEHSETALSLAVEIKHLPAMRLLLSAGADPNVGYIDAETPLGFCARRGFHEMARLLLRCGATETIDKYGGSAGMNPLGYAASQLDVEMVKLMLEFGADPDVLDLDYESARDRIREFPRFRFEGKTPETPENLARYQEIRRLLDLE